MSTNPANIFGEFKIAFQYNKDLAEKAVAQLTDEQLRVALQPETNSVAVIMKHLAGNLCSRWTDFLTSDGEKPWRDRDDEFKDTFADRNELMEYWERGWACLFNTLDSLSDGDLQSQITIRGEALSVPLALGRSLSHCGYHVGQIVMISRFLAGDSWQTLTIPRGMSAEHNATSWGNEQYKASGN